MIPDNLLPIPHVKHLDSIILSYDGEPRLLGESRNFIKERVSNYLSTNPNIEPSIQKDLEHLVFRKGMNQEQVELLTGEPNKKDKLEDGTELWLYSGKRNGYLQWYGEKGRLSFKDNALIDIEVQYIYDY